MLEHPEIVGRFLREGRAACKIEGEHVARVLDVDTLDANGIPFLVMEFLEGKDLSSVRAANEPLPPDQAVHHVLQACSAIAQAHAKGIVHRDLKPANLFLTRRHDGTACVKVLDFGISKLTGAPGQEPASVTRTTAVMGSVEYMSPEQMLSTKDADARSDIWAIGVILYELTTARVPFPGENLTQVCALVMSTAPPAPRSYRPEIPAGLEAVILRCLQKDRAARFASIAELTQALRPFAGSGEPAVIDAPAAPRFIAAATEPSAHGDPSERLLAAPATPLILAGEPALTAGAGPNTIAAVSSRPHRPAASSKLVPVAVAAVVLGLLAGAALWRVNVGPGSAPARPAEPSPPSGAAAPAPLPEPQVSPVLPSASAPPPETSAPRPAPSGSGNRKQGGPRPLPPAGPRPAKPPPSMD
jgi:eukaryotic-like serine/threonine-protein kinase